MTHHDTNRQRGDDLLGTIHQDCGGTVGVWWIRDVSNVPDPTAVVLKLGCSSCLLVWYVFGCVEHREASNAQPELFAGDGYVVRTGFEVGDNRA